MSHLTRSQPGPLRLAMASAKRRLLGTIVGVATDAPLAALTFDDGPDPEFTPQLLAVLERHHARGTFFMLGQQAADHPTLLDRVAAGGHTIGNHTFDHVRLPQTPRGERLRQLWRCRAALRPYGAPIFRPPYGGQSVGSRIDALLLGYAVVAWSAHVEDWLPQTPEALARRIEDQLRPGAILLLHDRLHHPRVPAAADRRPLIAALDLVLGRLGERFRFVTVTELLRSGRPLRTSWFRPAL
ncbi:MAG: polysaccharide deacetylase family protein [Chloroflexi bacterium OHK40]